MGEKEGEKGWSGGSKSGDVTVSINAPHSPQYLSPEKFSAPHVLQDCKPSAFLIIVYHLIRERAGDNCPFSSVGHEIPDLPRHKINDNQYAAH